MDEETQKRFDYIREQFLEVGIEALMPEEILELLLYYAAPRTDHHLLVNRLIWKYGSLRNVLSSSMFQLETVGGLSKAEAMFLYLVSQTHRQMFLERMEIREGAFEHTVDIGWYFLDFVKGQNREMFLALCLTRDDSFLACYPVTDGGIITPEMEIRAETVRRVVECALQSAAEEVVLCHYQTGRLLKPSFADRALIEKVQAALDTIQVEFRDYFIVTHDEFVSLTETGVMKRKYIIREGEDNGLL